MPSTRLQFGSFSVDSDRRQLSEGGAEVHLTPKALHLLHLLIENRPRVLRKEEIYAALWPDTFVEESSLSVLVSEVRKALHDDPRKPSFLKTAFGFGYGFIGDVAGDSPRSGVVRLRSGGQEFSLLDGENIIGRDPDAVVRLSGDGISRRHARIVVSGTRATIEDLGSKNGTYVQGRRIDSALELDDGDEIRISRHMLVVMRHDAGRTTVTELG